MFLGRQALLCHLIIFSGTGSCSRLRKTRWPSLLRRKLKLHTYCENQPLTQNTSSPTGQQGWHIQYRYSLVYYSLSALYSNIFNAGHCEGWTLCVWRLADKKRRETPLWGRHTGMPTILWYSVRISTDPKHPSLLLGTRYVHFPHSPLAAPLTVHLYSTRVQVNLDPSPAGMPTRQSKPTCSHAYTHTTEWNQVELQDKGRHQRCNNRLLIIRKHNASCLLIAYCSTMHCAHLNTVHLTSADNLETIHIILSPE